MVGPIATKIRHTIPMESWVRQGQTHYTVQIKYTEYSLIMNIKFIVNEFSINYNLCLNIHLTIIVNDIQNCD
jgi:hypothetical protein